MKITNNYNNVNSTFKSLYTVNAQENPSKVDDVLDLADRYCYQKNGITAFTEIPEDNYSYDYSTTKFIGEDYDADDAIETMLSNKGINFTRTSFFKLLDDPESVKERVVLSPEDKQRGFKLVNIDKFKFDEMYEYYGFAYVGRRGNITQPQRMERFEEYLKTGKKIHASSVYITEENNKPRIVFGDGRHRYAYMRDIGTNGIPVALNDESIRVARKYGLLAE